MARRSFAYFAFLTGIVASLAAGAAPRLTLFELEIDDDTLGGGVLDSSNGFGAATGVGDLDGVGPSSGAVAVGAPFDGPDGSVFILFLDAQGQILSQSEISTPGVGADGFGASVAWLGDYDGDGRGELVVGEREFAGGGRIWVLDLTSAGTIDGTNYWSVETGSTNFTTLVTGDDFGHSAASLGDWNGDGAPELLVGAQHDDDGGNATGAAYVLYLDPPATPNTHATGLLGFVKLSATAGGFDGTTASGMWLGSSVSPVGDLDGDGQIDLALGAQKRVINGAVYVSLMDPACGLGPASCVAKPGTVEIRQGLGGFQGTITGSRFGSGLAWLDDPSGVRPDRLAVGNRVAKSQNVTNQGDVWLLTLNADGTVASELELIDQSFTGATLTSGAFFGYRVGAGDFNGDSVTDLLVGAGHETGDNSLWLLPFAPCPTLITHPVAYYSPDDSGDYLCPAPPMGPPGGTVHLYANSGSQASDPGEACESELGTGQEICGLQAIVQLTGGFTIQSFTSSLTGLRDSGPAPGATRLDLAWVAPDPPLAPGPLKLGELQVNYSAAEDSRIYIDVGSAGVSSDLRFRELPNNTIVLPEATRSLGLACGILALWALARRRGGALLLWLLCLTTFGAAPLRAELESLEAVETWSSAEPGFPDHNLSPSLLGYSSIPFGDLDGDGIGEIVVGSPSGGEFYLVYPNLDGRPLFYQSITSSEESFGASLARVSDLDGDGIDEIAASSWGTASSGCVQAEEPSITLIFLDGTGAEKSREVIRPGEHGFVGTAIDYCDVFGRKMVNLGDIDGDGSIELAVGAPAGNPGGLRPGEVWILSLSKPDGEVVREMLIDDAALGGALEDEGRFGGGLAAGDVNRDGVIDLTVGAPGEPGAGQDEVGSVWVLNLATSGPGNLSVASTQKIDPTLPGDFPFLLTAANTLFGSDLAYREVPDSDHGVLYIGSASFGQRREGSTNFPILYPSLLQSDGTIASAYQILHGELGLASNTSAGASFSLVGDIDGNEVDDLFVGDPFLPGGGGGFVLRFIDSDGDHIDEELDNCPTVHNPEQLDTDSDGVGDVCDLCIDDPDGPLGGSCSGGDPALLREDCLLDTDCDGVTGGGICSQGHDECTAGDPAKLGTLCTLDADCDTVATPGDGECSYRQDDTDGDGEGDACEPVEIRLEFVDTPPNLDDARWKLSLSCGTYEVTGIAAGMKLPQDAGIDPDCAGSVEGCFTVTGGTVTASSLTGPGLTTPTGVRDDTVYFDIDGAPLCTPLQDPPVEIGILESGTISGTALAASALTEEGVVDEGYLLELAVEAAGAVAIENVRLINGAPAPILDLELGPAVATAGGTKWEVRVVDSTAEFFRVAFALVAPAGTTTGDMQWVGCTADEGGTVRSCCPGGGCSDFDGLGVGTNVNPNRSFTVGPRTPPGSGIGSTQVADTLYVVLEGSGTSSSLSALNDTLNPAAEGLYHVLGEVLLSSDPDLGPALSVDGANDIEDHFAPTNVVNPLVDVDDLTRSLDEVRLIGAFNPADDIDLDGIQDLADNCPFIGNPSQQNRGSFLDDTPDSNSLGDACECADATGDGVVTADGQSPPFSPPYDFDRIFDLLSGNIVNPNDAAEIRERCSVAGTTDCNIRDLVLLGEAINAGADDVPTRCDAALAPATP